MNMTIRGQHHNCTLSAAGVSSRERPLVGPETGYGSAPKRSLSDTRSRRNVCRQLSTFRDLQTPSKEAESVGKLSVPHCRLEVRRTPERLWMFDELDHAQPCLADGGDDFAQVPLPLHGTVRGIGVVTCERLK